MTVLNHVSLLHKEKAVMMLLSTARENHVKEITWAKEHMILLVGSPDTNKPRTLQNNQRPNM